MRIRECNKGKGLRGNKWTEGEDMWGDETKYILDTKALEEKTTQGTNEKWVPASALLQHCRCVCVCVCRPCDLRSSVSLHCLCCDSNPFIIWASGALAPTHTRDDTSTNTQAAPWICYLYLVTSFCDIYASNRSLLISSSSILLDSFSLSSLF